MKHKLTILIFMIVVGFSYIGYRSMTKSNNAKDVKQEAVSDKSTSPPERQNNQIDKTSKDAVPRKFQFIKAAEPQNFKTEDELRNSFSGSDRLVMDEFYKKFDQNAIAFKSPEQYEWLKKNGYPMPDEVVAAYKMSTDDLGALVDEGNVKASYFYLMREVYNKNSGDSLDKMNKTGYDSEWTRRYTLAERTVLRSGSPFTGYMLAAKAARNGAETVSVYAGYGLAAVMGDGRALNALAGKQDVDLRAIISSLSSNMDMMRIENPNVFLGKPTEFPDRYSVGVSY